MALNGYIVFRLKVLQRRCLMPCLALKVIVCNFNVAELVEQGPVIVSKLGYFLLQRVLRIISLCLCLLVLSLRKSVLPIELLS